MNKHQEITISWSSEDIIQRAVQRGIYIGNDHIVTDILHYLKHKHDATVGINWDVIDTVTDLILEEHKKNQVLKAEQNDLMVEIRESANINIVTCGNCASVILHKTDKTELKCPYCNWEGEISDFPDLIF